MAEDGKELYDGGIELEMLVLIHYLKNIYIYVQIDIYSSSAIGKG